MDYSRHFGLIGGLGVGATVIYYQALVAACVGRGFIPRITIGHAHAPTALAHVQAGTIDGLARYLAGIAGQLAAAGAEFVAIPAITPHICRAALKTQISVPLIDILDATVSHLHERQLTRVALFGTKYTIDSELFGTLDEFVVIRPKDDEVDEIHRIYLLLATSGHCPPSDIATLRSLADSLCKRDGVEAVVLAGTDLNLIFDEATAGFPAVDCAANHINAIVARMLA